MRAHTHTCGIAGWVVGHTPRDVTMASGCDGSTRRLARRCDFNACTVELRLVTVAPYRSMRNALHRYCYSCSTIRMHAECAAHRQPLSDVGHRCSYDSSRTEAYSVIHSLLSPYSTIVRLASALEVEQTLSLSVQYRHTTVQLYALAFTYRNL